MNLEIRTQIFARLREANPHPTTELKYGNPFQLLVAVILSAQSTDVGVNKATAPLFRKVRTPAARLAPAITTRPSKAPLRRTTSPMTAAPT